VLAVVAIVGIATAAFTMNRAWRAGASDPAAIEDTSRSGLAVMFLDNRSRTPELEWMREGLAEMLITGLSGSKTLTVLGRQQVEAWLDRLGHRRSDDIGLNEALDVARRAKASHVIVGSFAKLGETIRIDARLHTSTGRLVGAEALIVHRPHEILSQVDLLAWKFARHLGSAADVATGAPPPGLTSNLDAYRYYSLGVSRANAYQNEEAIDCFRRALALDPHFVMAQARIGYAYGVTWGQPTKGKPYLAAALRASDRLTEGDRLRVEAWFAIASLDYLGAIAPLEQLIALHPNELEPYHLLGRILAGERRFDEALDVIRRGLAVDPDSGDLHNRLGGLYTELGRHDEAIVARQKHTALEPSVPNAHDGLGLSYQWAGRYEEAFAAYRRALDLDPEFELAVIHLGNAYLHTGRYREATEAYRRYLAIAPSDIEVTRAYNALAFVHYLRGEERESRRMSQQEMKVGSAALGLGVSSALVRLPLEHPNALNRLRAVAPLAIVVSNRGARHNGRHAHFVRGQLALKSGDPEQAIEHFRRTVQEPPPYWEPDPFEDCLANAYLEIGRFDEAIAEYRRILELNPRYPLAHYRLGQAYERKEQLDLARRAYQTFLDLWRDADDDEPHVRAAREWLARASTS
jgi:tetratricopeptide (TPR) repeat protein